MKLNIVSFNIRYCNDTNGYSVKERAPRLYKIIEKYDPDIIGFQEFTPLWKPYITSYFEKYNFFNKYRSETIDIESSPIFWKKDKFVLIKSGYFWLSDTPEIESRGWDELYNCHRMCIYVILREKSTDKIFTFMNTHFGFGNDGQIKSGELIYKYSKKISDYPTILVGDFNMTPDTAGYRRITEFFTDVNSVTKNDCRPTFHGYNPEKYPNEHIDYCFVDDKVSALNQSIIDDLVDGKFVSDHYGLFINLDI